MSAEVTLQLGITAIYRIKVFDPITGDEVAADPSPDLPTLTILDPDGTIRYGPTEGTLVGGSTGRYDNQVFLDDTLPEGEYLLKYVWKVNGNPFKPRTVVHYRIVPR